MKRMICLALTLMLVVVSIPNNALAIEEVLADEKVIIEEPAEENAVEEYAESAENDIVSELIEDPVEEVEFELGGEADVEDLPIDEVSEPAEDENAMMKAASSDGFIIDNGILVKYTGGGWDIEIPSTVTSIAENAFENCRSEKNMILAGANATIGLINLTSITIPSSVKSIPTNAFSTCNKAEFIVEAGSYAEQYCKNVGLNYSTYKASNSNSNNGQCGDKVFWELNSNKTLYIRGTGPMWNYVADNDSVKKNPWIDHSGEGLIDKVVIESGVTSIGNAAFYECSASEFDIPDSVASIGESAFAGCLELKHIELPDGIKVIRENTFAETAIENIKWPASLEMIENWAFSMSYLKKLSFPNKLKSIGKGAFFESNIEEIYIPASVNLVENNAFQRCDKIRVIQVANGSKTYCSLENTLYTKEMDFLVHSATNVTGSFVVPSTIQYIGAYAFEMSGYSSISLPEGLKGIGDYAFHGCFNLNSINIPSSVISISDSAFVGWSPDGSELEALTATVIPGSYGEKYFKSIGLSYKSVDAFTKGRDNWSFDNSPSSFGPKKEGYEFTSEDRWRITHNLRGDVLTRLSKKMSNEWNGSCYGMSVIAILSKMGVIDPSHIQSGKKHLHDVTIKNKIGVESFINYYHMMQYMPKMYNYLCKEEIKSRLENIRTIISMAQESHNTGNPFLIMFSFYDDGAHAVVGYDCETGIYNIGQYEYRTKISIYDPNCPDYDSALYCNSYNANLCLTHGDGVYAVAQLLGINDRSLLEIDYDDDSVQYDNNPLWVGGGNYSIQYDGKTVSIDANLSDGSAGVYALPDCDGSSDAMTVFFPKGPKSFSVIPDSGTDFMYLSPDGLYDVDADNVKEVSFTKDGAMSMSDVSGSYEVNLIIDAPSASTPWTETRVSGKDADIAINPTTKGLVISGENLKDVIVVASNDNGETEIKLNTEQTSVLVTGNNSTGNKPSPTVYEDTNGDGVYETPVAGPEVVSLSGSSLKKTVKIGDEFQIDVPDLTIKSCKSSKTKVAAVSDGGYVVAKGEGSAKITVTLTNKKKRTLSLTVVDPYKPSGISLAQGKTATLSMGDTLKLTAALSPATARTTLTWKSSKTKIAKVDSSGVVTPVAEGKAKITVTTANKKKAEITITVVDPYKPSSVSIYEGKIAVLNMGDTVQLNAVLAPATARSTLTWKSSKTKIATVDSNGIVTPKAEGTAKITVTTGNKKTATISVHVVDPYKPTGVSLNQTGTVKIGVGQTLQLYAELSPDTARTTLTWSSSAKKYATVTNTGLVTGVKKGSAKITVKTENGKKATVKITVDNTAAPSDNWLSNFESGKSGVSVYSSTSDILIHSNSGCTKASGTQVKYTLENALNSGKEPCPTCMASAAATVYASKDDPYYHTNKSHAKSGAIATNAAKARAYGLAACPTCSGEGNDVIDGNSDPESIRSIQEMLKKVGLLSQTDVSGVYGASTISAVSKFQQWVNTTRKEQTVEVTGIVDNLTRLYLEYCVNNGMTVS